MVAEFAEVRSSRTATVEREGEACMEADGMAGIGADKAETLDRIAGLLLEANGAALAVEDDFLAYLLGIALLHVSEARADAVGFATRRLVS